MNQWQVYSSLGNIYITIWTKPFNLGRILAFSNWWIVQCPSSNNIPALTISTNSGNWCLHILTSLDSTSHLARWCNGVVMRWKHSGRWLFQCPPWLFQTLRQTTEFPPQKTCCASTTQCIWTISPSTTSTMLQLRSSTCRSIWSSILIRRMFSVESTPVNLQRCSWKPWKCTLLLTNRRNGRVTLLEQSFGSCKVSSW